MAVCKRSMPVRPLVSSSGTSSMIMAVQLQITMVSIRTPSDWVRAVRTGSLLWAAAASAGSGAGIGFIGKQAALNSIHENSAETAGYRLTHAEGL